jgi:hypothetical protein
VYNVLNIVFILHLQVIIPTTWSVDEGAWEFMADRMGYAVATMVAHGLETRERLNAALSETTIGLACSGLSYRQLDGVEDFQAVSGPQIPFKEVDGEEEEGDEDEEEGKEDPEAPEGEDDLEDTVEIQRGPECLDQFEFDDDDLQGDGSPGGKDTGLDSLVNKLDTESPHQSTPSRDNKTSARTPSPSPVKAPSRASSVSSTGSIKTSDKSASHSPGRAVPVVKPEEDMLSSTKHVPEQKRVSQGKPVSEISSMSLTEGEDVAGCGRASPLPGVASNTDPTNPFQKALGNVEVMAAFVGLMSALTVRGRGLKHRI